ncbi:uncharacterized protein A4U43_C02F13410 [Asparagus officinalis]|uniref:Uncharacterized protein n=1 Tax=Asparagus officinalis TaxID=4686 RepID=A0A5P1FI11_ASPOF|nr:uncharacterized protein A4U43_C02F13410 [Asparagus officinalis]
METPMGHGVWYLERPEGGARDSLFSPFDDSLQLVGKRLLWKLRWREDEERVMREKEEEKGERHEKREKERRRAGDNSEGQGEKHRERQVEEPPPGNGS